MRRDINCLSDGDRMVRRGAILRLEKTLLSAGKAPPEFVRRLFLEDLHKPVFRMFADQNEKCRELAISMTSRLVDLVAVSELENLLPLLLAGLLGRFRMVPFPEQSEELRLEGLRLLSHLFGACKERLNPFASDIIDGLAKALNDTCPDAKKECCEITNKVSAYFDGERVSRAAGPLVSALVGNLRHQQWKVRKATVESLGSLLSKEAPMLDHMEEVLPQLSTLLNDRTPGVRQSLAEVLERWLLTGLGFKAPLVQPSTRTMGACLGLPNSSIGSCFCSLSWLRTRTRSRWPCRPSAAWSAPQPGSTRPASSSPRRIGAGSRRAARPNQPGWPLRAKTGPWRPPQMGRSRNKSRSPPTSTTQQCRPCCLSPSPRARPLPP